MSAILTRFAEWDRFGDKTQRACVPLSQLRRLFESAPAETISEITEEMTTRYIEMAQFSLGSSKLTSIIELLTLFGRHSGLWSLESEVKQSAMTLRFYHDLGRQYSIFLCNSIAGALKKAGASDIQAVEDTHIVTIQIPFGGARSPTPSTELFDAIEAHRRGRMGSLHEYEG